MNSLLEQNPEEISPELNTHNNLRNSVLSSNSLIRKAPLIKPKLEDTFPSIFNLSSEMNNPKFTKSNRDSFNKDSIKLTDLFGSGYDNFFGITTSITSFFPRHGRALSNEELVKNKKLDINAIDIFENENENNEEEEKNENKGGDKNDNNNLDSFSDIEDLYQGKYYEQIDNIIFEGNDKNHEDEKDINTKNNNIIDRIEEIKEEEKDIERKNDNEGRYGFIHEDKDEVFIEKGRNDEEDDEEGYNILCMLKKKKGKNSKKF